MLPIILSLITFVLFLLSKTDSVSLFTNPLLSLSQVASLIGAVLLSFTFLLSSRFNFLEKFFGSLDKIYKQHHLYGAVAFLLLISHPLLLALQAFQNSISANIYLFPSTNLIYSAGVLALYSLILFLTFTLLIKIPYHLWYFIHQLMGIVLFFALIHVNFINSDISRSPFLRIWIIGWLLLALVSSLYKKFLFTHLGPKFTYKIDHLKNINSVIDLTLSTTQQPLRYHPGQFIFISFRQKNISPEFHPFSLASSPDSSSLRLYIKILGDYTATLSNLTENTPVTVMGPYGQLYKFFESEKNLILIAGGIGITPFISMIETEIINPKNRSVDLFYTNKNPTVAINHQPFQKMATKNKYFKYHPIFSDSEPWFTAMTISSQVSRVKFLDSVFLLCGPQKMMEQIQTQLISLKIKPQDIYYEDFSLN